MREAGSMEALSPECRLKPSSGEESIVSVMNWLRVLQGGPKPLIVLGEIWILSGEATFYT